MGLLTYHLKNSPSFHEKMDPDTEFVRNPLVVWVSRCSLQNFRLPTHRGHLDINVKGNMSFDSCIFLSHSMSLTVELQLFTYTSFENFHS